MATKQQKFISSSFIDHILGVADDAYLTGHPEWNEIVKEFRQLMKNKFTIPGTFKLAEHIIVMDDDAYFKGDPEWSEIVKDAKKVIETFKK